MVFTPRPPRLPFARRDSVRDGVGLCFGYCCECCTGQTCREPSAAGHNCGTRCSYGSRFCGWWRWFHRRSEPEWDDCAEPGVNFRRAGPCFWAAHGDRRRSNHHNGRGEERNSGCGAYPRCGVDVTAGDRETAAADGDRHRRTKAQRRDPGAPECVAAVLPEFDGPCAKGGRAQRCAVCGAKLGTGNRDRAAGLPGGKKRGGATGTGTGSRKGD